MRYQWEQAPNPDVNVLHVEIVLRESFDQGGPSDTYCYGEFDDEDQQFLKDLIDIPGVVSVSTSKHQCQIGKARLFDWADIRPQAIEAFRRRFAPNGSAIEAGSIIQPRRDTAPAAPAPEPAR